jgi:acetolactate synthase-1/2/3 large subunit
VEPQEAGAGSGPGLAPAAVAATVRALAPEGAIATVDAGSHMFAATLFWTATRPRRFLISNGLATMGYGLPAAIGASLLHPEELVVCFTGDGGLAMAAGELATAARVGTRLVVIVFNDATLNLIKIKQQKRERTTEGLDFDRVEWARVARGMGLEAFTVADEGALTAAFEAAVRSGRPALIDVAVDASSYGGLLTLIRG